MTRTSWVFASPASLPLVCHSLADAAALPMFTIGIEDDVSTAITGDDALKVTVQRGLTRSALHTVAPDRYTVDDDTGVIVEVVRDGPHIGPRLDRLTQAIQTLADSRIVVDGNRTPFDASRTEPELRIPIAGSLLDELAGLPGALGAALVDYRTGGVLDVRQGPGAQLNVARAAHGNLEVVRAKLALLRLLRLEEQIEDIVITLSTQLHIIRPLAMATTYVYFAGRRPAAQTEVVRALLERSARALRVVPL